MLQAELKILGGKHQGKAIPLSTKKFLVGREQDCHLRPNSDLVSRHHCVFSIDDFAVRLRDLGSTNGTRVNGKPLHGEVTLKSGDQIGIGKLELEVVIRQRVADAAPQPEVPLPVASLSNSELEITPASSTVELPVDGVPNSSDTSFELPTSFALPTGDTSTTLTADTAIIPGGAPAPAYPAYAPPQPAAYPGAAPAYPGAYPGYQQPMGYPQQQMGYPQQPMAYPQYPQSYAQPGYPAAMPGYQMQYPAQQAPQASAPAADAGLAVKLPPPESTGVKAPAPAPPVAADAAGGPPKTEEKPSNTAADIIKNYMQRRTR